MRFKGNAWIVAVLLLVPRLGFAQMSHLHPDMAHLPDFTKEPDHPAHIVSGKETIASDTEVIVVQASGDLTLSGTVRVVTLAGLPGSTIRLADNLHLTIRNVPFNLAFDPEQFGHGLVVHGTWIANGRAKTTKIRTIVQPLAGTRTLLLESPVVGWQSGDKVIVGETRPLMDDETDFPSTGFPRAKEDHTETCLVDSLSPERTLVTCAQPFRYDHFGGRDDNGDVVVYPPVANASRSIVIDSEDPNGVRGHVMFTSQASVDMSYVELNNLGRTCVDTIDNTTWTENVAVHIGTCQNGRYALHAHHLKGPRNATIGPAGETAQARFVGLAINDPRKWGIAIHDSDYGLYKDNVIVRPIGAGIVTETGQEYMNAIDGNFIADVIGSNTVGSDDIGGGTPPRSIALDGDGGWASSGMSLWRNNIVMGARFTGYRAVLGTSSGIDLWCPKFPGADTMMPDERFACRPDTMPFAQFDNNEVWSARKGGALFYVLGKNKRDTTIPEPMTINGFTSVASGEAFVVSNSDSLTMNNVTIIGGYKVNTGRLDGILLSQNHDFTLNCVRIYGVRIGVTATQPGYASLENPNWFTVNGRCADQSLSVVSANVAFKVAWDPHNQPRGTQSHSNVDLHDLTVRASATGGYPAIKFWRDLLSGGDGTDVTVLSTWKNVNVNGKNTEVFAPQQAPNAPMPATGVPYTDPVTGYVWKLFGSVKAGLTNAEAWAQEGVAFGGRVATCTDVDPQVFGFECPQGDPPPPPPTPTVTSVTVTGQTSYTAVGQNSQMTATAKLSDGTTTTTAATAWQSSNPVVASISSAGLLTTRSAGSSTISAIVAGVTGTLPITVTVTPPPPPPPVKNCTGILVGTSVDGVTVTQTGIQWDCGR